MKRWALLVVVLACTQPETVTECGEMAQQNILSFKGLVLQPNDLGEVPPGALAQADNVVVSRDGMVEPRRGYESVGSKSLSRLHAFSGELVGHSGSVLSHSADGATWSDYAGTLSAPTWGVNAAEVAGNLFLTASDGIKRLDSPSAVPETAGVPEALDVEASAGSNGTAVPDSTSVAYRVLFGKRTGAQRLLLGAPSGRYVFTNTSGATKDVNVVFSLPRGLDDSHFFQVYRTQASIDTSTDPGDEMGLVLEGGVPQEKTATSLSRTTNVVTATTSTDHGYAVGQIVRVGPGGSSGGVLAAVGTNVAATSSDGAAWTSRTIGTGDWYALAVSGSRYVALSITGTGKYSDGGATWSDCTGLISGAWYRAAAYGNGKFVAVTFDGRGSYSSDGASWSTASGLGGTDYKWSAVVWNGSKFLATGYRNSTVQKVIASSVDGQAWSLTVVPYAGTFTQALAWTGSRFVAGVANSTLPSATYGMWYSTDGVTWTPGSVPVLTTGYNALAYSGTALVAVRTFGSNQAGDVIRSTDGGLTWSTQLVPAAYNAITWDGTRFVTVGSTSAAATVTADGATWTPQTMPSTGYRAVIPGAGAQFDSGEKAITSTPTGTTFTYAETGVDGSLSAAQAVVPLTGAATDTVPDGFLGAYLYTNQNTGTGILSANDRPPLAVDVASYRDTLFALNVTTPAYGEAYLLAVSGSNGLQAGDTVTINGVAYTAAVSESISGRTFKLETGGTVSQNITKTAASLIRIVNRSLSAGVSAKDVSDPSGVPGLIGFRATDPVSSLTVSFSRTTAWSPAAGISAAPQSTPNGLVYSKPSEPDHIARALTLVPDPVGSKGKAGERLTPTRDSLLIWTEDGLFRLTGTNGSWSTDPLDPTIRLMAPRSAVPLAGSVFALTNQGVVRANEGGVEVLSRDIEPILMPLLAPSMLATTQSVTRAIAYESDRKYVLLLPTLSTDTSATQAFVYDYFTRAWTRWEVSASDGLVNPKDDRIYLAAGSSVLRERKSLTTDDYRDASAGFTCTVRPVPVTGGNPGALNLWTEAAWIFRTGQFSTAAAGFSTNVSPAFEDVTLSGSNYGATSPVPQLEVRVGVPQEKARGSQLNLRWSQTVDQQAMQLQGVSVIYRPCSTRLNR